VKREEGRIGVLLVNLGTPDSPSTRDVRRYLRQFLSDERVVNYPRILRWLLLNLIILPFRPRTSAAAYQKIWMDEGSPLLHYGRELAKHVTQVLGIDFQVELAMRYGSPSIASALKQLLAGEPTRVVIVPLFPQYAIASTGSAVAEVSKVLESISNPPNIRVLAPYYDDPRLIHPMAEIAKTAFAGFDLDHILLSFHGLPEWQLRELSNAGERCLEHDSCCDSITLANRSCYRAHCFATARALTQAMELPDSCVSVVFQSRLGRTPWLEPDLPDVLPRLAAQGTKRLGVICPAFVADCLETLEEVGIRADAQWRALGGESLCLAPCVNDDPRWVNGLASMIRECSQSGADH
jgi:ferrochelatase